MEKISVIAQLKLKRPTDIVGTIIIRAFYNRRPIASKSTGYKVNRGHWNNNTRRVLNSCENAALLNTCIQNRLNAIQAELLQKEIMGAAITTKHISDAIRGYSIGRDFIYFCHERIEQDYSNPETKQGYYSECRKLQRFKPHIYFIDIEPNFLQRYRNFMRTELKNSANTQWRSLKFVYLMVNKAMDQGGILKINPFDKFDRGKYFQTDKPYLTVEEIDRVEKLIQDPTMAAMLKKVAARFLLMVYSGMRFGDAMKFNPDLHVINGRFVMQYKKFSGRVNYIMHTRLLACVELIKEFPLTISNQKFNEWLKALAGVCKIQKNITTHTGRHTMGYLLSEMDVPKEKAKLIMAHRDDASLDTYYHVTDGHVDREIIKLNEI